MFQEFENLQARYRQEAYAWRQAVTLPEDFDQWTYQDKIDFALAGVKKEPALQKGEMIQRAYHRCRELLGDDVDTIEPGNFNKSLMWYFLNDRRSDSTLEDLNQQSQVIYQVQGVVLDFQFRQDTNYIYDFNKVLDKPTPVLGEPFAQFLKAGELRDLTEVLLYVGHNADGPKTGKTRENAVNGIVASLMARLTDRHDLDGTDIEMLIENGDLKPKPLHACDFYLDNIVPAIDDKFRATARNRIGMSLDENSVFLDIKDKMSDREIFNYLLPRPEKTKTLDNWVVAMAKFEELTGKTLTIREALALEPQHGFNLAATTAYQDRLDQVGTSHSPESFRSLDINWTDDGYDNEDDVHRVTVTLDSSAFLIEEVTDSMDRKTLNIPEIRATTTGADFVAHELEFESQADMLARRSDIRIELKKLFMESIKSVPLPGDSVMLAIPEGYDEEDVNTDTFRVGDEGVVTAVGYFGGNQPVCKIKGIYGYQDPEHLEIIDRPKVLKKRIETEPEPV